MRTQSHHLIVTYNPKSRNASAVNEFVNGCETRTTISRPKRAATGHIRQNPALHDPSYALGAGDRQFKSGHPDFYFLLNKRIIILICCNSHRSPAAVNEFVNC